MFQTAKAAYLHNGDFPINVALVICEVQLHCYHVCIDVCTVIIPVLIFRVTIVLYFGQGEVVCLFCLHTIHFPSSPLWGTPYPWQWLH